MIPYGRQSVDASDIDAVADILRSDFLTQGPAVERFEHAVAEYVGGEFAIAVNSATSALHLACRALGLGKGDVLWTSPNTFVASANCGLYCGAEVDFVDIDPKTYNLSIPALKEKLDIASHRGRLPKVIVVVHFAGQPCDMEQIWHLSGKYGFSVIEDASHAIGAAYKGKKIGDCSWSDIAVFSFHPVKLITTGEGGMALTKRKDLYEQMSLLRSHGITRDPARMTGNKEGEWYYEQIDLGYNYRITDIQAALGWSQLRRLDGFLDRRREQVQRYNEAFSALPVTRPWQDSRGISAWHLYVLLVDGSGEARGRDRVFTALRERKIGVNVHYIPVHLQPFYRALGFKRGDFPVAEHYYERTLTLPLHPAMTDEQQAYVIKTFEDVIKAVVTE